MKFLRLSIAALTTAVAILLYFLLTDRDRLQHTYLCFKQAVSIAACYAGRNIDFVADIDGIKYEGNLSNGIDKDIFYYGAYEKPLLFLLRDIMHSVYANKGVFIDVGANTGQHSLFMSRYAPEVHAFEPWQPVLKRFHRMIELNHIKNIVVYPVGLGDQNARRSFYKPTEKNLGTGSFVEDFTPDNSYDGELEIRIGDEVLEQAGVKSVALIKMDVEGYEKLALTGLRRTLWKDRPIVEFELSADPKSRVSIKSRKDLTALFPENYRFVTFFRSDPSKGTYFLGDIEGIIRFDLKGRYDVLAYPAEKTKNLVLDGPRN
jgi:FkbM family methyltransferase